MPARRPRRVEAAFPLSTIAIVALLAIAVLPTALRPPPPNANNSAALDPSVPPEDSPDAIISSFQQAGSATAGASKAAENATVAPTSTAPPTTTPDARPSRNLCFGDPPRQIESIYSAPCEPAFVGDNGGATYKNVSADEIRVGLWHSLSMPTNRGPISPEATADENAASRTHRVLQDYWNANFEFYGRRLQLVALRNATSSEAGFRGTAAEADEEYRVFAASHLNPEFCDEFARRELVCYDGGRLPASRLDEYSPFWWSLAMAPDQNEELVSDFVCAQLVGRDAIWAGGREEGTPRRIGAVFESSVGTDFRTSDNFRAWVERRCGEDISTAEVGNPSEDPVAAQQIADSIARFRLEGVTTIIVYTSLIPWLGLQQSADSGGYYPEWVLPGEQGLDFNDIGRAAVPAQMLHTFGFSGWEIPQPFPQTECYRAYKTMDPDNAPNEGVCRLFFHKVMQVLNGIQNAGPNLNPDTFLQGMYEYANRVPDEFYAMQGGYGPGDHAFGDANGAIWWDPTARDPAGGEPGAFRWILDGRRFRPGDFSTEPLPFFESGITQP